MSDPGTKALAAAERLGVPLVTLGYVLAFVVSLHESADKLGWRVLSLVICAVCVAWAIYVWLAKRAATVGPNYRVPRFNRSVRIIATSIALVSAFPLFYPLIGRFATRRIPPLRIKVQNNTGASAGMPFFADFYLSEAETPATNRLLQAGRLELKPADKAKTRTIPPGQTKWFEGHFRNEAALLALLERGDIKLDVMINMDQGVVRPFELPFARADLEHYWIWVIVDEGEPVAAEEITTAPTTSTAQTATQ